MPTHRKPNPPREQACDVWYHETIIVKVLGIGGAIETAVEKTTLTLTPTPTLTLTLTP